MDEAREPRIKMPTKIQSVLGLCTSSGYSRIQQMGLDLGLTEVTTTLLEV